MPPIYVYRCASCGETAEETRKVVDRNVSPEHRCGPMALEITGTHKVIGSFTPYRAVGRGRPFIKSRAEHKAYLRRNNYEEVGNDRSMAPEMEATDAEWSKHQAQRKAEIEKSYADNQALLASVGITDQ